MADEIVVKVEGEEDAVDTAEQTAAVVIDMAVEIAEKIDGARQEESATADEVREVKYSLDDLWGAVSALNERVGIAIDLLTGLSDQVAELAALEVAEVVVTEPAAKVEEVAAVAEVISEQTPEKVEVAVTPQTRQKKQGKWI